jgi:hypothetical protein
MRDAKLAVETGVDGLDVVIGTSSFLREHSHGKDMAYIEKTAIEVIEYIKSKGLEVRCESAPDPFPVSLHRTLDIHSGLSQRPGDISEISEMGERTRPGNLRTPFVIEPLPMPSDPGSVVLPVE